MWLVSKYDTMDSMAGTKFQFGDGVSVIGGGECSRKTLEEALSHAPRLIAADGGAARALGWGLRPELVIGDMDSLDPALAASFAPGQICRIGEQESTDFAKLLRVVSAPLILAVGFLGGRIDHTLAALNALVRHEGAPVLLLGEHDLCLHVPRRIGLALPPGSRLSLFPLAPVRARGAGLVWPLEGLEMRPGGRIGTSNEVDARGRVRLAFDAPGTVLMLERAALGAVLGALGGALGGLPAEPPAR